MRNKLITAGVIGMLAGSFLFSSCNNEGKQGLVSSLEEYRELRTAKLNKARPLIHNNDGNDVIYYPIDEEYSVDKFLDKRSRGLIGTDVTTISYCPIASGFGNFTYDTKVGEVLVKHGYEFGIREQDRNITAEMLAEGTDPLKVTVEFAQKHGFEVFFSNRMNDTHDAAHRADKPYFLWTEFKEKHPEFLFGSIGEKLPNGRWSSVDFAHKEVRDLCVQFFKEVCDNYDVDGVELDFFRHFELFKTVGRGGIASQKEVDMLTDMVREIRKVTEEAGMKRGKPILVLTRVPTSPEYAKQAGVDIEQWIDEGLVDIVVGSDYFRLDFWQNFAKLGEGKNVKMYAGLSESRVRDEHPLLVRQQNAVFRARAAAAWEAGLDGMYSFNEYNTKVKYLREIGHYDKLKNTNNLYFVTYRDARASRYLKDGDDFFKTPRLSPTPGTHKNFDSAPFNFDVELGDESSSAKIYALVYADNVQSDHLMVKINDAETKFKKATDDGLYVFEVDQASVKPGINKLYIANQGKSGGDQLLKDAALFFCRDKDDAEMQQLIALCVE